MTELAGGITNVGSALFFMGLIGLSLGLTYYSTKVKMMLWRLAPSLAWLALGMWVLLGDASFLPVSSTWTQVIGFCLVVMVAAPLTLQMVTEVGRTKGKASWTAWERSNPGKSTRLSSEQRQSNYRNQLRGMSEAVRDRRRGR